PRRRCPIPTRTGGGLVVLGEQLFVGGRWHLGRVARVQLAGAAVARVADPTIRWNCTRTSRNNFGSPGGAAWELARTFATGRLPPREGARHRRGIRGSGRLWRNLRARWPLPAQQWARTTVRN